MEERLSIIDEEKFAECRLCNHLVSSINPICKNCGLETSSEGIIELAEIDDLELEDEISKLNDAFTLRVLAILSLLMMIFTYLFSSLGIKSISNACFLFGEIIYIVGYISINRKLQKTKLSNQELQIIRKEKTFSLSIFLLSTFIGSLIFIYS